MSQHNTLKRRLPLLGGGFVLLVLVAVMVRYVVGMVSSNVSAPKPVVQTITVLNTPPPPPPPPPKQEETPEKIEEKIDEPPPEPAPTPEAADDQPPAGDSLGLDADGSGSGDGFGLMGRKGGRDLLAGGGGGAAGRAEIARFGMAIKSDLHAFLADVDAIRSQPYDVSVKFWFDAQGHVKRYNVVKPTGNVKTDELLKVALDSYSKLPEAPPDEQTRTVTVRITSRI